MKRIRVLEPNVANRIAAGEVVERPQSVVKELVENAIDAGATAITVEIENGGIDFICVRDNGSGIAADDIAIAFLRHATSKISTSDDIRHIESLGFRGEALASIASVAEVTVKTRQAGAEEGTLYRIDNGVESEKRPVACTEGTVFEVRNLFSKVPARLKFLKSSRTEAGAIGDFVSRMILAYPGISFSFLNNGKQVYRTYGENDLSKAVFAIYGKDIAAKLRSVDYDDGYIRICGFIGLPEISRPNRNYQTLILNDRYIKDYRISNAVQRAFDTRLLIGKFPFFVLKITLSPYEVDINVHPQKQEARFADEMRVSNAVYTSVFQALNRPQQREVSNADEERPVVRSSVFGNDIGKTKPDLPGMENSSEDAMKSGERISVREVASVPESNRSVLPVKDHTAPSVQLPGFSGFQSKPAPLPNRDKLFSKEKQSETPVRLPLFRFENKKETAPVIENTEENVFPTQYRYVGNVLSGYLIIESDQKVFLIDQHAAHERILYETLSKRGSMTSSQKLILPRTMTMSAEDYALFQEKADAFGEFGFDIEPAEEPFTVLIHALPVINGKMLSENSIIEILEDYRSSGEANLENQIRSSVIQIACKHAVKVTETLSENEIKKLLEVFRSGSVPLTCPHGRPVIVCYSNEDIERAFKRIV